MEASGTEPVRIDLERSDTPIDRLSTLETRSQRESHTGDDGPTRSESDQILNLTLETLQETARSSTGPRSVVAVENGRVQNIYPADCFSILSLDGGGIRGLFSACLLAEIQRQTGINPVDHFDLIAGTSTGGIIALALALGRTPIEVEDMYERLGPAIFPSGKWRRRYGNVKQLFGSKFSSNVLEQQLRRSDTLGDFKLRDCCRRLVIPCYNLSQNVSRIFRTPRTPQVVGDGDYEAWRVALATSAAPTYFPACDHIDHQLLVDGGIWANNPALLAVVEAISHFGQLPGSIRVFSIGTCINIHRYHKKLSKGGLFRWASPAINVAMRGQSTGTADMVKSLVWPENSVRFDPPIPYEYFKMDKYDQMIKGEAKQLREQACEIFKAKFAGHFAPPYAAS